MSRLCCKLSSFLIFHIIKSFQVLAHKSNMKWILCTWISVTDYLHLQVSACHRTDKLIKSCYCETVRKLFDSPETNEWTALTWNYRRLMFYLLFSLREHILFHFLGLTQTCWLHLDDCRLDSLHSWREALVSNQRAGWTPRFKQQQASTVGKVIVWRLVKISRYLTEPFILD